MAETAAICRAPTGGPGATAPETQATVSPDVVLGHFVRLMLSVPAYRHLCVADLEWMVLPPRLAPTDPYRRWRPA
jgi:hypothetical protein